MPPHIASDTTTSPLAASSAGTENTTTTEGGRWNYDYDGAKNFIIVTVLVYSLIGTLTVMLLRMCRRVRSSGKSTDRSDEVVDQYLRISGELRKRADRQQMLYHALKTRKVLEERSRQISPNSGSQFDNPSDTMASASGEPDNPSDPCADINNDVDVASSSGAHCENTPILSTPSESATRDLSTADSVSTMCVAEEAGPKNTEATELIQRNTP